MTKQIQSNFSFIGVIGMVFIAVSTFFFTAPETAHAVSCIADVEVNGSSGTVEVPKGSFFSIGYRAAVTGLSWNDRAERTYEIFDSSGNFISNFKSTQRDQGVIGGGSESFDSQGTVTGYVFWDIGEYRIYEVESDAFNIFSRGICSETDQVRVRAVAPEEPEEVSVSLTVAGETVSGAGTSNRGSVDVSYNSNVSISWSSENADECRWRSYVRGLSGERDTTSGSTSMNLTNDTTFWLRCQGNPSGDLQYTEARIDVNVESQRPVASLRAEKRNVSVGEEVDLIYGCENADEGYLEGPRVSTLLQGTSGTYPVSHSSGGDKRYTLRCTNAANQSDTDDATITVEEDPNTAPIADTDRYSLQCGITYNLYVLSNDEDPDGDSISVDRVGMTQERADRENEGSFIQYTVPDDFDGYDYFRYRIKDEHGLFDNGSYAYVYIRGDDCRAQEEEEDTGDDDNGRGNEPEESDPEPGEENNPPIANNDHYENRQCGTTYNFFVLENDRDPDQGDLISIDTIGRTQENASVSNRGRHIRYTVPDDFDGHDYFRYRIVDSQGAYDNGSYASVHVRGEDCTTREPQADFDYSTDRLDVDFQERASDSDGSIVSYRWEFGDGFTSNAANPSHGYRSAGSYSVTLTVTDDDGLTDSHRENINIAEENRRPDADNDRASTWENTSVSVDVLSNDSDPDGDNLDITGITSNPRNGTASISGDEIRYTPDRGYTGSDQFNYRITDGEESDEATVSITVRAAEDYSLSVHPSQVTLSDNNQGVSESITVSIARINGFDGRVDLSIDRGGTASELSDATFDFSDSSLTGSERRSSLVITVPNSLSPGLYPVEIEASSPEQGQKDRTIHINVEKGPIDPFFEEF